jgi:acetate---CoA ligase (ADP-forming)
MMRSAGDPRDVRALFAPDAVAVVGASDDNAKYGNWISVQALSTSDARPVYLVNRRGERVLGEPTFRRLADRPSTVDLVVIAVPAAAFEQAVEDALAIGTGAIVGVTSGFAELGIGGAEHQAAIARRVRPAGSVLLGPNCLGVVDTTSRLQLSSNAMPAGPVGLISQSGNVALELSLFLTERGLGVSRFASLGNQADLRAADLLRSYTAHAGTRLIAIYCEDFVDGRAFAQAAADAVSAGKRIVLLTVGSSQASVRGRHAATHGKPVFVHAVEATGPAADALREEGIPVFRAGEDAARTLGLLTRAARGPAPGVPALPVPARPVADDGYWTARELLRGGGLRFPGRADGPFRGRGRRRGRRARTPGGAEGARPAAQVRRRWCCVGPLDGARRARRAPPRGRPSAGAGRLCRAHG